jgi:hypothetical protein
VAKRTRLTNEILFRKPNVSLWCGPHHSLTSRLIVLSAFFVTAAVAAAARIESDVVLLAAFLIVLSPAGGAIILRVTSRRVLTRAFASALLHPLIPFSIVCHIVPPLWLVD